MYIDYSLAIDQTKWINTSAHKQNCSKTCETCSLHIPLKMPDDGVRLKLKHMTFGTITHKTAVSLRF
jgi:hypothetical protein